MKIELFVNGVSMFSGENVQEEISGKLERKDAFIGLYLMAKRGTPFAKIFSCQLPEKIIKVEDLPNLPEPVVKQAMALFTPTKQPQQAFSFDAVKRTVSPIVKK